LVSSEKSILTKDVLLQRGGDCDPGCHFCGKKETINHLLFQCPLARYMWNVVSCAIGECCQFESVDDCLVCWLDGFNGKKKKLLAVGIASIMWSIWKARNLACFQKV
jgi:hypothetical protein